jgi:hypothetical protein
MTKSLSSCFIKSCADSHIELVVISSTLSASRSGISTSIVPNLDKCEDDDHDFIDGWHAFTLSKKTLSFSAFALQRRGSDTWVSLGKMSRAMLEVPLHGGGSHWTGSVCSAELLELVARQRGDSTGAIPPEWVVNTLHNAVMPALPPPSRQGTTHAPVLLCL